jgi:serine O-acetyltransferase
MANLPAPSAARAGEPNDLSGRENRNPAGIGLLALLREDLATHESLWAHGFWALAVNRFGNWRMDLPRPLRAPATLLYALFDGLVRWTARIELPYIIEVGRRVRIWHHGGCVLGARRIGDDVQLRHNVTFGLARHGDPLSELPLIEERVVVGAGACVLGRITVGHYSVIAANAVVTEDVPPYSLVGGIPGRVLKRLEPSQQRTSVHVKAG